MYNCAATTSSPATDINISTTTRRHHHNHCHHHSHHHHHQRRKCQQHSQQEQEDDDEYNDLYRHVSPFSHRTLVALARADFHPVENRQSWRTEHLHPRHIPPHPRKVSESGGEVIRQENRPGGIVTAELCVLDDISRAPGEALNILLRILNERKYGGVSARGTPPPHFYVFCTEY